MAIADALLPHQREALTWLLGRGGSGILAMEPGTGKTLVALAALEEKRVGRALIIAPVSLLEGWRDEIKKWTGGRWNEVVVRASPTVRAKFWKSLETDREMRLVIVSYETARKDIDMLRRIAWGGIVMDETYKIQNPSSRLSRAMLKLSAPVRIALNGTLISNGYGDIWTACHWIKPGSLYNSFWAFRSAHAVLHPAFPQIVGWRGVEDIKARAWPLILFKKKTEVLTSLPPMTEQTVHVDMSREEWKTYELVKNELRVELLSGEEVEIQNALVKLLRLRQVTGNVGLFVEGGRSSKLEAVLELLETIPRDAKVIVFSMFKETVNALEKMLADCNVLKITGEVNSVDRDDVIRAFRSNPLCRVLLGTDALAYGVNLQEASYIINVDLPWSYAKYEQRVGRAWRMGQKQNVTVYNMQCDDTIDKHVAKILEEKTVMGEDFRNVTKKMIQEILL